MADAAEDALLLLCGPQWASLSEQVKGEVWNKVAKAADIELGIHAKGALKAKADENESTPGQVETMEGSTDKIGPSRGYR